jgi:hypothetical protein
LRAQPDAADHRSGKEEAADISCHTLLICIITSDVSSRTSPAA